MITRAIIHDILDDGKRFKVRIPIFDNIESAREYTANEDLSTGIAIASKYVKNELKVGDAVIVGFEDNDDSKPIILGLLSSVTYDSNPSDISARSVDTQSLKVSEQVNLPIGTNIGNITYGQLLQSVQPSNPTVVGLIERSIAGGPANIKLKANTSGVILASIGFQIAENAKIISVIAPIYSNQTTNLFKDGNNYIDIVVTGDLSKVGTTVAISYSYTSSAWYKVTLIDIGTVLGANQ